MLEEATQGDRIEIFYAKENKYFGATVIDVKEADGDKPRKLKYIYDGYKKPSAARWISVADTTVRYETTEENSEEHHVAAFTSAAGHLEDDLWEVAAVVGERGEGDSKEYLVRWAPPWTQNDDSWEPLDAIEDPQLIADFEAERDRERLEAEAEARRERAKYIIDTVTRLRTKVDAKLRKVYKALAEDVIVTLELCEEWRLLALYEHARSLLLEGENPADHVEAISQFQGQSGRSKRVGFEFYIKSHVLLERFLGFSHVRMQPNESGIGVLTPIGFVRRGPRADMSAAKLEVKAGFGALVGRGHQPPFWKFEGAHLEYKLAGAPASAPPVLTTEARGHQRALARRLLAIEAADPGTLTQQVNAECVQRAA